MKYYVVNAEAIAMGIDTPDVGLGISGPFSTMKEAEDEVKTFKSTPYGARRCLILEAESEISHQHRWCEYDPRG